MRVLPWSMWEEGSLGTVAASSLKRLSYLAEQQRICSPSNAWTLGTARHAEMPWVQPPPAASLAGPCWHTAPGSWLFSRFGCSSPFRALPVPGDSATNLAGTLRGPGAQHLCGTRGWWGWKMLTSA